VLPSVEEAKRRDVAKCVEAKTAAVAVDDVATTVQLPAGRKLIGLQRRTTVGARPHERDAAWTTTERRNMAAKISVIRNIGACFN
jgi:hypothetical protein